MDNNVLPDIYLETMELNPLKLLVFRLLLGLCCIIAALPGMAQAADVVSIRLGVQDDRTRIVLDLSAATGYRVEPQTRSDRIVIALDDARFLLSEQGPPAGRGLVKAIRVDRNAAGASVLILELAQAARVTQAQFLNPSGSAPARIFVDLRAGSPLPAGDPEPAKPDDTSTATAERPLQVASTETVAIPAAAAAASAGAAETAPADADLPIPPSKPSTAASGDDIGDLLAMVGGTGLPPAKPIEKAGARKSVIVLDAGHGGKDPGAVGANGTMEKDITLRMAKELKALLEGTGRYKVVLTRDDDMLLALRERIEIAREAQAELFISLHADHNQKTAVRGASVYTLSENASDAEAATLAARENKEDLIAGVNLSSQSPMVTSILIDLAQRETKNMSARFASILAEELAEHTQMISNSHRFAGFVVLKAPDVPSVLVELGYLSNVEDEEALGLKRHRRVLARAIRDAVDRFFEWQRDVRRS